MSIEFPPTYPATPVSTDKPVNVQTLQDTFAATLRSFLSAKEGSNTMLDTLTSPTDKADDRNQQRRDNQQPTHQNDFQQINRKLLDKSELRHNEINADHRNRVERHETLQNEHYEKVERREPPQQAIPANAPKPVNQPLNVPKPNELSPQDVAQLAPQQKNVPVIAGANNSSPSVSVAAPNNATVSGAMVSTIPVNVNVPVMPVSMSPQVAPPQTFTIFTASGRFGQMQEKSNEKDDEDEQEESVEEKQACKQACKPEKKHRPFAMFEAIHAEITRPVRRSTVRQSQEPPTQASSREKPKESDLEQPQNVKPVKTLDEFLNMPLHIAAPKKGEPQQPAQYLQRIAAAVEAAAQHAPIRIKINLDHLGTLTLRFFFKSDKLTLRFETPTKESARFLREHLDEFETIISERNVHLASVEVALLENEKSGGRKPAG